MFEVQASQPSFFGFGGQEKLPVRHHDAVVNGVAEQCLEGLVPFSEVCLRLGLHMFFFIIYGSASPQFKRSVEFQPGYSWCAMGWQGQAQTANEVVHRLELQLLTTMFMDSCWQIPNN